MCAAEIAQLMSILFHTFFVCICFQMEPFHQSNYTITRFHTALPVYAMPLNL